jgi:hypothetical protein
MKNTTALPVKGRVEKKWRFFVTNPFIGVEDHKRSSLRHDVQSEVPVFRMEACQQLFQTLGHT